METPIHKSRDLKYPDFTVVTNYGVIVLEVKDWIQIVKATPHDAIIRTRDNKERREANPVETARNYLYLSYMNDLPAVFQKLYRSGLVDFVH